MSQSETDEVYLYDGRGSVSGVITESSKLVSYAYTACGDLLTSLALGQTLPNSPTPTTFGYNAEATDSQTGLQYLRARYYSPETGRFIQKDEYKGDFTKPETLNRYAYCSGNPVLYSDPSGYVVSTLLTGLSGGTKGQKIGGAIASAASFVATTAIIIGTAGLAAPVALAIGVGAGLVLGASADYAAQSIANKIDGTNREIDKGSILRSSIFSGIGGLLGGGLGFAMGGVSIGSAALAGVVVNTLVIDPVTALALILNTAVVNKKSNGIGCLINRNENRTNISIRTDKFVLAPSTPTPW